MTTSSMECPLMSGIRSVCEFYSETATNSSVYITFRTRPPTPGVRKLASAVPSPSQSRTRRTRASLRGHYAPAVALMLSTAPPGPVTVGSDHDRRNGLVLEEYARRTPGGERIVYVGRNPAQPPLWFLRHDFDEHPVSEPALPKYGACYALAAVFPCSGLSGFTWLAYRRSDDPPRGPPGAPCAVATPRDAARRPRTRRPGGRLDSTARRGRRRRRGGLFRVDPLLWT